MRATTDRTLYNRASGICRMIAALGQDPTEWEPMDLEKLSLMEEMIAKVREKAVIGMRESGVTDKQIGEALGITQQAVSKRWPGGGRYVGVAGRYRTNTLTT
jgi:DNA-binding NarL/FixJ family response regulator